MNHVLLNYVSQIWQNKHWGAFYEQKSTAITYHKSISILQVDFAQFSVATEKFIDVAFPRAVWQSS